MNTARMGEFLTQVSQAHADDLIVMVLDGASSHKAKELVIPENIRLLALPPYAPELNPQEHVWDELRKKEFPNPVFNHMDAVIRQLEGGLPRLAANTDGLRSLAAWPWIVGLIERLLQSDPGMEEAFYDSPALRRFVGVDLGVAAAPDETAHV